MCFLELLWEHAGNDDKKSPGTFAGADNQIKLSVKFFLLSGFVLGIKNGSSEGVSHRSPGMENITHSKGVVGELPASFKADALVFLDTCRVSESIRDSAESRQKGRRQAHERRFCFCFIAVSLPRPACFAKDASIFETLHRSRPTTGFNV